MSREKRPLDSSKDGLPNEKRQRPALTSVIVEALKMDRLEKLCSTLEPLLRRVVGEEVERALAKLAPAAARGGIAYKASPKRIQGAESRNLRLQFRNKLALPLFTGSKVEGEQGSAIHVVLQDVASGQVVTTGPEASAKLDIVVLEGDFSADDEEDWTEEEFENYVVKEREGKRPLLTGDLTVTLKEGVGSLGELTFTDNSSWIRSRKFRLGVKVSSGSCEGLRIREGKTDAFSVKDHRGELYKKHYPPALTDEVWRLDKIGKDGAFHKKLNRAAIFSVEDFLRLVVMDPQKLRNILGSGMSNRMWESTVEHAKTCVLSGKLYVYYADEKQNIGVIFNNIFQLMGLMAGGQYLSVDALSESEKVYVDKLVKVAYENWESVVEYDGEALIGTVPQSLRGIEVHTEEPNGRASAPANTSQHVSTSPLPAGSFSGQDYGTLRRTGASNGSSSQENYAIHPYQRSDNNTRPSSAPSVQQHGQQQQLPFGGNSSYLHDPMLATAAATTSDWLQKQTSRLEELYSEEDIRAKSLELLESEDMNSQMQQLVRMFNTGADTSGTGGGGGGGFESFFSSIEGLTGAGAGAGVGAGAGAGLGSPLSSTTAKGKVGWLKLKAALRWGIFIRKQAATRRAQIEELEDD